MCKNDVTEIIKKDIKECNDYISNIYFKIRCNFAYYKIEREEAVSAYYDLVKCIQNLQKYSSNEKVMESVKDYMAKETIDSLIVIAH